MKNTASRLDSLAPIRWVLAKDIAILRRSPLLVGILVIYPVALALMIGLALSSPPGKPKVAVYDGVKVGHGKVKLGGSNVNINAYTNDLFQSITPIRVNSAQAAIADVRAGRAEAAIIVPADIVSQVEDLIKNGFGTPTVRLVLNNRNPLERELVNGEIQTRVDELEAGISKDLLGTALEDLHIVVAGGQLDFGGDSTTLLGLNQTEQIISNAIGPIQAKGLSQLVPSLREVRSFAQIAGEGLSFASPVLGQIQSPLTVQRTELSGASTPTSTYAVAIAVTVSELFLALLLAAALLALERSEQVYARLVRGPVTRGALLAEKILLGALAAAAVSLIMSAVVSIFVGLIWGRLELWVLALILAGLAFAALGVALGAVARDVAAASLLAILVGLPVAFLALIPPTAVSGGLGGALDVISFVFPFRAGLEAISNALTGSSPGLGLPVLHLAGLALVYGGLGRLALLRFDD